jgi:hypothetical protein
MKTQILLLTVLWLTYELVRFHNGNESTDVPEEDDEKLVQMVKEGAKKKVAIMDIEVFVRRNATINTARSRDKNLFRKVDIEIDRPNSEISSFSDAQYVVYWVRPVESKVPKVVGLVWTAQNDIKLFFGVVQPP